MTNRGQNEKKFRNWDDLPGGGRIYRLDVYGRLVGVRGTVRWMRWRRRSDLAGNL